MKKIDIYEELKSNDYPGRGIVIGKSADGKKCRYGIFYNGQKRKQRNRVFIEDGDGIRTQAFDPVKA